MALKLVGRTPSGTVGEPVVSPVGRGVLIGAAVVALGYAAVAVAPLATDPLGAKIPTLSGWPYDTLTANEFAVISGIVFVATLCMLRSGSQLRMSTSGDGRALQAACLAVLLSASIPVTLLGSFLVYEVTTGTPGAIPFEAVDADEKFGWGYGLIMVSWGVAVLVTIVTWLACWKASSEDRRDRRRSVGRVVLAGVLLAPFGFPAGLFLVRAGAANVIVCAGSTLFALWVVHGLQRHRRMPFRVVLGAFALGVLVSLGFALEHSNNVYFFVPGIVGYINPAGLVLNIVPPFFEEIGKAAAVLVAYLFARRWFDNVASGVVLGAAVGLGFNFVESLMYMSSDGATQYWLRQSVWIFAGHTAFTALTGAGFGIAHHARSARTARLAVAIGLAGAMLAHFANNALGTRMGWLFGLSADPWIGTLLLGPAAVVLLNGPFVIAYLVILAQGLRQQREALFVEVPAEADTGSGAVTHEEVEALLSPARRFRLHVEAMRRGGWAAYRRAARLHAAQLDLAMSRWHHGHYHRHGTVELVDRDRSRVLEQKRQPVPSAPKGDAR